MVSDGYDVLDNLIVLQDESGEDCAFEFLDFIVLDSCEYVVLLPCAEDEEESGKVAILRVETADTGADEESYVSVDDEGTLMTVFDMFKERHRDEFDFED